MARPTGQRWPLHGVRIDPTYPYIEAEVRYAATHELAATATDVIARRTRLAFLNAQAALEALPRVIDIMAEELGWNGKRCGEEFERAKRFLASMGCELLTLSLAWCSVKQYRTSCRA
jgi:glycerol-3-phosphate dehydrogenase